MDVSMRGVSRVRALAAMSAQVSDEAEGVRANLQRLCLAVTEDLALAGATVTLMPEVGREGVAASSTEMEEIEQRQLDAGDGPTREAHRGGQPVVVTGPNALAARWPAYTPVLTAARLSAVVAIPLRVGAASLGAMSLYWRHPDRPAPGDLRRAFVYADLGLELLVDHSSPSAVEDSDPDLIATLESHGHVYQAQGMVMVELHVGLPEALARMRVLALTCGQSLAAVAGQIVDGTMVLTPELTHDS